MLEDCGNIVFLLRSFLKRRVSPGLLTVKKEKNRCMDLCLNNRCGEKYIRIKGFLERMMGVSVKQISVTSLHKGDSASAVGYWWVVWYYTIILC